MGSSAYEGLESRLCFLCLAHCGRIVPDVAINQSINHILHPCSGPSLAHWMAIAHVSVTSTHQFGKQAPSPIVKPRATRDHCPKNLSAGHNTANSVARDFCIPNQSHHTAVQAAKDLAHTVTATTPKSKPPGAIAHSHHTAASATRDVPRTNCHSLSHHAKIGPVEGTCTGNVIAQQVGLFRLVHCTGKITCQE